jgi:CDP-diacylglycerol---glycerol-3-phosphate 3-phosphatidyltransferase
VSDSGDSVAAAAAAAAGLPFDPVDPIAAAPPTGARLLNPANGLTVLRVLLVPVFLAMLLTGGGDHTGWRLAACAMFALASFTDRMDGQLARSRGLITPFGQIADPIADKALTSAALIGLSALDELAWWVTVVVVARDVGVTILRLVVIRHGVIPASRGGKLKTLLQTLAIGLYLLPLTGFAASARTVVMALAVVVTVVTGADYVIRAWRLRRTSPRAEMKRRRGAAQRAARKSSGSG